jgi:glutathione synthase/RimK-type ligase-like ATP-grasp enzyme
MNFSYGKWTKYQIMKEDRILCDYLPETKLFSYAHFWEFLDQYGEVVIKPSEGAGGYGVIHVEVQGHDSYALHGNNLMFSVDRTTLISFLNETRFHNKLHIVQQVVPLALIEGSPFDIRVVVKRSPETNEWRVKSKLARIAAEGYFITNVTKEILPLNEAIERTSQDNIELERLNKELDYIALKTARRLQEYYPIPRNIGIDIGFTQENELYIIEANLRPGGIPRGVRHHRWTDE